MQHGREGGSLSDARWTLPSVPVATPKLSHPVSYRSSWGSLASPHSSGVGGAGKIDVGGRNVASWAPSLRTFTVVF